MSIKFTFLRERKPVFRLDVFPFLILYAVLIYFWLFILHLDEEVYAKLAFIVLVFSNCMAYLIGHWSTRLKSVIQYSHVSSISIENIKNLTQFSSHVLVTYVPKQRSTYYEIVPI